MSWDAVNYVMWKRCYDCERSVPEEDFDRHVREHVSRPEDDAMTLAEVAAALGHTFASVQKRARRGVIKSFVVPGTKRPRWVTRQEFERFAARIISMDPGAVVRWARTEVLK